MIDTIELNKITSVDRLGNKIYLTYCDCTHFFASYYENLKGVPYHIEQMEFRFRDYQIVKEWLKLNTISETINK